ncbi:hypothetical protein Vadar_008183 [Vaccinium darrowii]|uniref:Uncharacterized protein n=1 Tax=Vaccinium darrowii TaxID=229202 RepID=A0ACB7XPG4_9ERIC|nr:hypothetical protein Vadar_008183 [Vaccinium darrowii]
MPSRSAKKTVAGPGRKRGARATPGGPEVRQNQPEITEQSVAVQEIKEEVKVEEVDFVEEKVPEPKPEAAAPKLETKLDAKGIVSSENSHMADNIFNNCVLEQTNSTLTVDENMEILRRKLEELSCQETDINSALNNAKLVEGKNPKTEVEDWKTNVELKKSEVLLFFDEFDKRGKKLIEEVEDLVQQGRFPEGIMIDACETKGVDLSPTIQRKLEEVWRCLMSDLVSRIGICGKGGVGRKNLANHIYNWILECRDPFENVYRVSVRRDCSIQQLQNDIAEAAGIDISDKRDEKRRATLLSKKLRQRKNTLFILDGMQDHFPLKKIGIPVGENGCKLIVTSPSQDVCHRMGCQSIIEVDPLPKEEALSCVDDVCEWRNLLGNLVQQGILPEGIMNDPCETRVNLLPITRLDKTSQTKLKEVWACLMENEVSSIGIYGKEGVGKRNITSHIHNKILEQKKPFDNVISVSVPDGGLVWLCNWQLQFEIAKAAGLDIADESNEKGRATQLWKGLMKRKNTVFIVNDMPYESISVHVKVPLSKIGIPVGVNGCKLIVTSKSRDVCHWMGCQRIIEVELPKEEAWTLFMEELGHNEELEPDIKEIAESIVDECDGLPSAIIARARAMDNLIQHGRFREGIMIDACEAKVNLLPTTRLGKTSQTKLEEVWACLMKNEVSSIGIYGKVGVGKRNITEHIHNRILEHKKPFDNVISVTVGSRISFCIQQLQFEIAKAAEIDITVKIDENILAAILLKGLMKRKNIVVILNDMPREFFYRKETPFPLRKIGIPIGVNGCKLIVTSKSQDVCHWMGCQPIIEVERLPKEEAWTLFMEELGHNEELESDIKEIAESIVDECGGLPSAIIARARAMDNLIQHGRFRGGIMIDACEAKVNLLPTTRLGKTSQTKLEEIWACLMKNEVSSIGIYGKVGVDKRNIIEHIHNRILEHKKPFNNVISVTVGSGIRFCIRELQFEIAKAAGLDISVKIDEKIGEKILAALLSKGLMKRKNIVIILNDMPWKFFYLEEKPFPLRKIGIPTGVNGCKLIVTSESRDVCYWMGCQPIIEVEPLPKEEAWTLFMEELGHNEELEPDIKEIAESIVDECDGLPHEVIRQARSMRGVVDINEWRNSLKLARWSSHSSKCELPGLSLDLNLSRVMDLSRDWDLEVPISDLMNLNLADLALNFWETLPI